MGPDIIARHAQRHDSRLASAQVRNRGVRHGFELRLTTAGTPTLRAALSDKRLIAVLLMSFASGLPFNLTGFSSQAWLASEGINVKTIGIFTLVGFPYTFKFLWAPILDRYLPPVLGRRRGWILIFQICLTVAIALMGFSSPTKALYVLAALALLVAFLSASQDIVIDAYRVDAIPVSERGPAAAVQAFGYRTAAMLAGTVLVLIAAHSSWHLAFLMVACLMAATTLGTLWAPEPDSPGEAPRTLINAVWHPLKDLISQKGAWAFLLFVLLYKAGDAFALSLYSAFMIKGVGFSLDELSLAGKFNMTVSSMIGVALGGWAYMRWGTFKSLLIFGIGQALTNLLYTVLALAGRKVWLLALATTLDTGVGGMGLAAFTAFLVSLCTKDFSATQYALLSAIASVGRTSLGAVAGFVVDKVGWANFFVVTCLTAVPGLILLVVLRAPIQELAAREKASANAGRAAEKT